MRRFHCAVAAGLASVFALLAAAPTRLVGENAPPAASRPAGEDDKPPPPTFTRVYDVRELLMQVPQFDDTPEFSLPGRILVPQQDPRPSGGGGGFFGHVGTGENLKSREDLLRDLFDMITQSVAADSWRDAGGSVGSIKEWNGNMVVTQTAENHAQLRDLLNALREAVPKPVRIRAHWVVTQRRELDKLLKPAGGKAGSPILEADPEALEKLPADVPHYRAEVLCLEGQKVFMWSAFAEGVRPVPPPEPAEGEGPPAEPSNELTFERATGVGLRVSNTISADRKSATLTLAPQMTPAALADAADHAAARLVPQRRPTAAAATRPSTPAATGPTSRPAAGATSERAARPGDAGGLPFAVQELRTTVRVPLGRPVLVGGSSLGPSGESGPGPADPPQVYLFVEVTAE